jgi:hypothetical protein
MSSGAAKAGPRASRCRGSRSGGFDGFGIAHDYRGYADDAERTAFLVDTSGTVRGAWRYETAEVPDFDVLLSAARAL